MNIISNKQTFECELSDSNYVKNSMGKEYNNYYCWWTWCLKKVWEKVLVRLGVKVKSETSSEITDCNPVSGTISVCGKYHGSEIIWC